MRALHAVLAPVQAWNDAALAIGRWVGIIAIAFMVAVTLVQVFARYVLNDALAWPDEAARFAMLWLTGLLAPTAYRRGGFVSIDMLLLMLPLRLGALISLILLAVAGAVLLVATQIGWSEITGFGGRFATASLYLPWGDGWFRIPRSWMMASLFVGVILLLIVNLELILRSLIALLGGVEGLRPIPLGEEEIMAE